MIRMFMRFLSISDRAPMVNVYSFSAGAVHAQARSLLSGKTPGVSVSEPLPRLKKQLLILGLILVSIAAGQAATYTWDANGATVPNPSDGNGTWSTASRWWNGAANVTWTDGNEAVIGIGSGTAGAYSINVGAAVIATNLTFNAPGSYTLTNSFRVS